MWHSVKMRNAQSDSKVAGLVVDSIPKRSWHRDRRESVRVG